MTNPVPSDLLARILDLVEEETGQVLGEPATEKLTRLLPDLAGQKRPGELGERFSPREVAVLLTDLRGFTSISETFPATTVLEVLNIYLTRMTEVVAEHGGTVDKFMGDSVMALFGAPTSQGNDAECAVICAVDMQIAMVELNEHHLRLGLPDLFMGIGVNTGLVMAGRLGSEIHSEYTVIGDDVNTASRIEAFSLRGQILISESTYERCHDLVSVGEASEIFVKGKEAKIIVREVLGIPSLGKEIPRHEIRRSLRVRATMPFTYQLIVDKIVRPEVRGGVPSST